MTARTSLALALLALLAASCDVRRNVWQAGVPLVPTSFTVESSTGRGDWIDAWLVREGLRLRFFALDTPACRAVLAPGGEVTYSEWKLFGVLHAGEDRCETVGIGSLDEWRRRQPRRAASRDTLAPRAQASFRILHREGGTVLVRGRFPLAGAVGWTGGIDTIAVLTDGEACAAPLAAGVASMEVRSGEDPLVLLGADAPCPIEGLIRPSQAPAS